MKRYREYQPQKINERNNEYSLVDTFSYVYDLVNQKKDTKLGEYILLKMNYYLSVEVNSHSEARYIDMYILPRYNKYKRFDKQIDKILSNSKYINYNQADDIGDTGEFYELFQNYKIEHLYNESVQFQLTITKIAEFLEIYMRKVENFHFEVFYNNLPSKLKIEKEKLEVELKIKYPHIF